MNPPNAQRKLNQLDNDVQEIYRLLDGIATTQSAHGLRLGGIDTRLDRLDTKVDALDTKLDTVLERLGGGAGDERG